MIMYFRKPAIWPQLAGISLQWASRFVISYHIHTIVLQFCDSKKLFLKCRKTNKIKYSIFFNKKIVWVFSFLFTYLWVYFDKRNILCKNKETSFVVWWISFCITIVSHFLGSVLCQNGMNMERHLFGTKLDLLGFDFLPIRE